LGGRVSEETGPDSSSESTPTGCRLVTSESAAGGHCGPCTRRRRWLRCSAASGSRCAESQPLKRARSET